eukprot:COSAG02_NODE_4065_length_5840_cov_16.587180_2_plen_65_part_00
MQLRATGLIQKLEGADIVAKSSNLTHREKEIAPLKYDPKAFIHRNVYRSCKHSQIGPLSLLHWD